MKRLFQKAVPVLLSGAVLLSMVPPVSAAFSDYTDVQGHWAQATLERAYADAVMQGYSSTQMAPNDTLNTAQALTILCRVLQVSGKGDISGLGLPEGAWYADGAAKAIYAGLVEADSTADLTAPISRANAFVLFARAFQMGKGAPDLSVLDRFSDTALMLPEEKSAAASLIEEGILTGSEGKLLPDASLTRAEFATILYRMCGGFESCNQYSGGSKSAVLTGSGTLSNLTGGNVWFACDTDKISLTNVNADTLIVRSDVLKSFAVSGKGRIGRLVFANGSGDITLNAGKNFTVGTLVAGSGNGKLTFTGNASAVEVTGDGREVTLNSAVDALYISGDHNTVTVKAGCNAKSIVLTGSANTVRFSGTAESISISGRDNSITGSGRVSSVAANTNHYTLSLTKGKVTTWENYDIEGVAVSVAAPSSVPLGQNLQAKAAITAPQEAVGKLCIGTWSLNGKPVAEERVLLAESCELSLDLPIEYNHSLIQDSTLSFSLAYTNTDGDSYTKEDTAAVWLETYEDLGLADAVITVNTPETLPAGQTLVAEAIVDTPETGKDCKAYWYVDGRQVAERDFKLGGEPSYLGYDFEYYYGMPEKSTVSFRLTYTTADGRNQELSGSKSVVVENYADNGIARASVSLSAPGTLEAGNPLSVTANLSYLEPGKICTGVWYVDDVAVKTETITLGTGTPVLDYEYTYTEDMKLSSNVKYVLSCTTADGRSQEISASAAITLKNYDYFYYHGVDPQEIRSMVTNVYAGDYTLNWALNHDYPQDIKTAWVNLQGYSSKTQYLIWVNLTYQRVNIFSGSQGNWTLIRECLCGSGKPSTPTIRGVFTTSYKQEAWSYGSYYCGPIVRFNGSSGYAFHSRLEYWPMNSDRYYDARIGFPVSHGCLRMYNDDIWYIYNNIPNGTTVVVH